MPTRDATATRLWTSDCTQIRRLTLFPSLQARPWLDLPGLATANNVRDLRRQTEKSKREFNFCMYCESYVRNKHIECAMQKMSQEIERLRDRPVRRDSNAFNSGAFGATAMPSTVHIRRDSGVRRDSDAFDVTVMPSTALRSTRQRSDSAHST